MAADGGQAPAPLTWLERLLQEPGRFDFHVALRRFDASNPRAPALGDAERPAEEPLRLGQQPSASFAGAEVTEFLPATEGRVPRMSVGFFGLWGPHGPLPSHLTEYAYERIQHAGDPTLVRFADLFHHRMLVLFYRAWAMGQPTVSMDRPDADAFARYLGAIIGLGLEGTRGRGGASDFAKLHYAPLFSGPRNPDGLRELLSDHLGCPAEVEEWVGEWLELPEDERWHLGVPLRTNVLGQAVLGGRVWSRATKFRVRLGPLDATDFARMLPGGEGLEVVRGLVRLYTHDEWEWEVGLTLAASESSSMRFGAGARLGWNTRLGRGSAVEVEVVVNPETGLTRRLRRPSPAVQPR